MAIDGRCPNATKKDCFFFAQLSLGTAQVSIVGPSNNSQPLILNPLAARIRQYKRPFTDSETMATGPHPGCARLLSNVPLWFGARQLPVQKSHCSYCLSSLSWIVSSGRFRNDDFEQSSPRKNEELRATCPYRYSGTLLLSNS